MNGKILSNYPKPFVLQFNKIGEQQIGFISPIDLQSEIPFKIKRIFYTYNTPNQIVRGRHAHYKTEQILIALTGSIIVRTIQKNEEMTFLLDKPDFGLYIPPDAWHTMEYNDDALQLVFASTEYDEKDYIRDFNKFKEIYL